LGFSGRLCNSADQKNNFLTYKSTAEKYEIVSSSEGLQTVNFIEGYAIVSGMKHKNNTILLTYGTVTHCLKSRETQQHEI